MTKEAAATAPATKKSAEGKTERAPKTDGPVYKAKAFYDKSEAALREGKMTRKDALAGAVAMGINIATATTQYGLWAKTKNIVTVRAKKEVKEPAAKSTPEKGAAAAKTAPTKKVVAKKAAGKK